MSARGPGESDCEPRRSPPHAALFALPLLFALAIAAPLPVPAQEGAAATPAPPTLAEVREAILRLESSAPQDPAPRDAALESLRRAVASLEQADLNDRAAIVQRQAEADAPRLTEILRQELASPLPIEAPLDLAALSLAELETALAGAGGELAAARAEAEQVQAALPARDQRRTAVAARLGEVQQLLVALEDQVRTAMGAPGAGADDIASAPLLLALSRRRELSSEAELLRAEQARIEAERELAPLRRERAIRRSGALERRVASLDEQVAVRRAAEAARAAAEAERGRTETIESHPELAALAEENKLLAARRTGAEGLAERIRVAREERDRARTELAAVRGEFISTLRKVQAVGLTDAMGRVLRKQLEGLPRPGSVARSVERTQQDLGEAQYQLIFNDESREESFDIAAALARVSAELGLSPDRPADEEVRKHAESLLRARLEHLEALSRDISVLSDLLGGLVATWTEYAAVTDTYRSYIEERILWVPSATFELGGRIEPARRTIAAYADRAEWSRAWGLTLGLARERVPLVILVLVLIAGLLVLRRPLDRRSEALAEKLRHHRNDTFGHTWRELVIAAMRAAPLPFALYVVGRALVAPESQTAAATATGHALENSAWRLAVLLLLAAATRPGRLAEAHFRWPASGVAAIHRNLWWLASLVIPAAFAISVTTNFPEELAVESLGVLAFEVAAIAIAVFVVRALRPTGEFLSSYVLKNPGSVVGRASRIWFPLAIAVPLALGALAMAGYVYTALRIWIPYERTFLFILAIVLVNELLLRWLFIARRRLAVEQSLARRKAKEEASGTPGVIEPVQEDELDIPALDAQTKQLFRAGILVAFGFGIAILWSNVLPALRVLDRIELFPELQWVAEEDLENRMLTGGLSSASAGGAGAAASPAGAAPAAAAAPGANAAGAAPSGGAAPAPGGNGAENAAAGAAAPPSIARPGPSLTAPAAAEPSSEEPDGIVTLADFLAALLLAILTVIALKNIPAVLEIAVLQRLPLDRGARYAIRSIVRYVLLIVGVSLAFGAVGIGWSSIQWLAAALTFGLAFGLQEIFANFVSGVIILLERPMRVGDTVTVAGIEGKVLRLQMRSTTIQDYDMRELLVPNKEFITGNLINWTLSDTVSRLVFPVGLAYGSDIGKATRILLEVARTHPDVLADPPPSVVFVKFGESTLDLVLRLFIPHRDYWAPVTHGVHCAIEAAFRKEGIQIAFPQRDLHLRSAPALDRFAPERVDEGTREKER